MNINKAANDEMKRVSPPTIVEVVLEVNSSDKFGIVLVREKKEEYFWRLPGGLQQPHETIEGAVRRCVHEQTGLVIGQFRDQLSACTRPHHEYGLANYVACNVWVRGDPCSSDAYESGLFDFYHDTLPPLHVDTRERIREFKEFERNVRYAGYNDGH